MSVDPSFDLTNLAYAYAKNDPINEVDVNGLCASSSEDPGVGAIYNTVDHLNTSATKGPRSIGILWVTGSPSESSILAEAFAIASGRIEPMVGTLWFTLLDNNGIELERSPNFPVPTYGSTPSYPFQGLEPGWYTVVGNMKQGAKLYQREENTVEVSEPKKQKSLKPQPATHPSCGIEGCIL